MAGPKKAKSKKQSDNSPPEEQPVAPEQVVTRDDKIRQVYGMIEQIGGTILLAALYGAVMCSLCYTIWQFAASNLAASIFNVFHNMNVGYANLLLPQSFVPYASWIALAIPATILSYHLIYAGLTGTLGINNSKTSNVLQSAIKIGFYALPFIGFGIGLSFGLSTTALFWTTWGLGALTGVYLSEIGQGIAQSFFPPEQEAEEAESEPDIFSEDTPTANVTPPAEPEPDDEAPAPPIVNDFARKKKSASTKPPAKTTPAKRTRPARKR